jgi:SAM-dependent methyltransferase
MARQNATVDLEALAALQTPAGTAALAAAAELAAVPGRAADPLGAAEALRRAGHEPRLAAAALTQATLRHRAVAKLGPDAARMYFTRIGLEQATRAVVAGRRASRIAATGVRTVADLGCGIGSDAIALARAGLRGIAIDADPVTAAVAAANLAEMGFAGAIDVRCADATTVDLSGVEAVFCDPARRAAARPGQRVFDPAAYSPPWSFVAGLPGRVPRTVLKLAPGIDHSLLPAGAEAEWVSVDGAVVEATVWCGPFAATPRRATVIRAGEAAELTGSGDAAAPVAGLRSFVFDPDGAVVRSHLVAEFAATVRGTLADPRIAYVFTAEPAATVFGHGFEVLEQVPFAVKRLRAALRDRRVGRLEIRKRGVAVDPDHLRRELKLAGEESRTLILTRIGDTPTALLCRPAPAPTAPPAPPPTPPPTLPPTLPI